MINTSINLRFTVYLSLIFALSACAFSQRKSRKLLEAAKNEKYDVIIVPGIPYDQESWTKLMQGRVYWAKYLYDSGITKKVMFSGSAVYSPYYESKIMGMYGEAAGIPKEDILVEIRAEHSTENVYYSYHKSKNLGYKKVALATDPFQAKGVKSFVKRKISKNIGFIPFVFDTLSPRAKDLGNLSIADSLAFEPKFKSITEREGFFKRLRGTLGKNINKEYYSDGKLQED